MVDPTKEQAEQRQATETPVTETCASDKKSGRDELKGPSQRFLRTLLRGGVYLATKPVFLLPEEPREHFVNAGREFTYGLALLAHELADAFDKAVDEITEDLEKKSGRPDS